MSCLSVSIAHAFDKPPHSAEVWIGTARHGGLVQVCVQEPGQPLELRSRMAGVGNQVALTRSQQMARIRGKDTDPERRLRLALWNAGLRYRLHAPTPAGRPDIVFPARKVAVFIDGCFWHGCPKHYVRPRSRVEFWAEKLATNVARDRLQTMELETLGWSVVRVWEHAVFEELEKVVARVRAAVAGDPGEDGSEWRVVRVDSIDEANRLERRYLQLLRDARRTRIEEGRRVTAKWKPRIPTGLRR